MYTSYQFSGYIEHLCNINLFSKQVYKIYTWNTLMKMRKSLLQFVAVKLNFSSFVLQQQTENDTNSFVQTIIIHGSHTQSSNICFHCFSVSYLIVRAQRIFPCGIHYKLHCTKHWSRALSASWRSFSVQQITKKAKKKRKERTEQKGKMEREIKKRKKEKTNTNEH